MICSSSLKVASSGLESGQPLLLLGHPADDATDERIFDTLVAWKRRSTTCAEEAALISKVSHPDEAELPERGSGGL